MCHLTTGCSSNSVKAHTYNYCNYLKPKHFAFVISSYPYFIATYSPAPLNYIYFITCQLMSTLTFCISFNLPYAELMITFYLYHFIKTLGDINIKNVPWSYRFALLRLRSKNMPLYTWAVLELGIVLTLYYFIP